MAFPTNYDRGYSFLGFSQGQGTNDFPGSAVDVEFDNVSLSVDQINAFLARSFSPEGVLKPGYSAGTEDFNTAILEAEAQATASAASAAASASFSGSAQTAASAAATSAATATAQATSAANSKNAAAASATAASASAVAAAASAASMPAVVATQYLRGNPGGTAFESRTAAQTKTDLGLVIGTDVQAQNANLQAIAGQTTAADRLIYWTGSGAAALATFTTAGRALVDDADAAAQRATLGLGTVATQAAGAVAITGGSVIGITDIAVADGGTGSSTASGARTNLGVAIGTDVQAFDTDLQAIAALASAADQAPYATGTGTWAMTTVTAAARTVLDDTTVALMLATLGGMPLAGGNFTGLVTQSGGAGIVQGSAALFTTISNGSAVTPQVQVKSIAAITAMIGRWGATAAPPTLNFTKSRGATIDTHGALVAADQFGGITTSGSDGTAMRDGPRILAVATAAPTGTLAPGKWFVATNDGTTTYTALEASETGDLRVGGSTSANNVIWQNRHHQLRSYTAGTLPAATTAGQEIYVSDGASGYHHAVSDGSKWLLENGQDASQAALNSQTGTAYTLVLSDANRTVEMNNASANTLTVPLNAAAAFPIGTIIPIIQMGAGQTAVAATGGVTIRSASGNLKITGQYSTATLKKRAADEWVLYGSLVP